MLRECFVETTGLLTYVVDVNNNNDVNERCDLHPHSVSVPGPYQHSDVRLH